MKKKKTVLIAGPLPPPAGGISVHIWRLKHLLEDEFNIDFIDEASIIKKDFFNIRSFRPVTYIKKIAGADLLFIHSGSKILKKLHILTGKLFGKKIILTLHGYGPKRKFPFRAIDAAFFKMANKIILVNNDIFNRVPLIAEKCIVKHAFLPPVMEDEPVLPVILTERITEARKNNKVVICANASRLDVHNNEDLYGLDMSIDVTRKLLNKGLPVSFIYTVSSLDNGSERFNKGQEMIGKLQLKDDFLLINEKLSFVKLIESADIVLRPTNTDGDALTVREALYLGKKILASDVTSRPEGTMLFKTRDAADLESKLASLVQESSANTTMKENKPEHTQEDFKGFYTRLVSELVS